ncbi:MAG TPA: glycoside hydrolase family 20 zincin-like fold domain-containing protein [Acidobacteriaceae bacterium]|nr:glycoside hydrolase family 20 zincin-like fold domain-containing protein [Acidobacteriaceae bacterium]
MRYSTYRRSAVLLSAVLFTYIGAGFLASAQTSASSVAAPATKLALVPMPREVQVAGAIPLQHGVAIRSSRDTEDTFAAQDLADTWKQRGVECRLQGKDKEAVELLRLNTKKASEILSRQHLSFTPEMHDEGYILASEGNTLYDIAATPAGIFYGAQTIKQLLTEQGSTLSLQKVTVRDWPAMKYRGLDDDLSRGPVPTLEYQKKQIRTFAAYKVNIYSPYFENTLRYADNPLSAPPGGAMTRADVEELVRYAQQYHITIIPEQEAFGHLHHTLIFEKYADLAETPHGSVLAPGQPGSLQLINQWFTQIAQMFPGPFIHIGADETSDLGTGQTKQAVEQQGAGKVYIDFLRQIYTTLQPLHKRLLFWGDIAMKSPELVKTLPKDMIAVAWEYSPHDDGFDRWIKPFTDAGLETWVAPGVNNWSLVYPNNDAALRNIQRFVADGQRLGTTGELNTVWNDDGEGLFAQDWYGVLFGAAAGWQAGMSNIPQFQQSYGQVFHDDTTGEVNQAQRELIAAHQTLAKADLYAATDSLFWVDPWSKQGQADSAKILPVAHDLRIHAENAIVLIEHVRAQKNIRNVDALDAMELGARRIDFIGQKFQQAQEIVEEYNTIYAEQKDKSKQDDMDRLGSLIAGGNGQCEDMRDGYGLIRNLYQAAWLKENRPYWLDNVLALYDMNMQMWIQRSMMFRAAEYQYEKTQTLPTPQELGLPVLATESAAAATQAP